MIPMLITLSLIVLFSILTLIHHTIFLQLVREMFLKFACTTDVFLRSCSIHFLLFFILFCTVYFHRYHYRGDKPFVCSVQTINNLYSMSRCSNTTTKYKKLYACDNINSKYDAVAHMYWPKQPSALYHILLRPTKQSFLF